MASAPPEIFDRALRRRRRDRAAPGFAAHAFLRDRILESLLDRLGAVTRPLGVALDLDCMDGAAGAALAARGMRVVSADAGFAFAKGASGVQCDEDRLPFADASFDLILSAGGLDQVNDLPGALALARRALRADGLLLAGFAGAGSLPWLRSALLAADLAAGGAAARLHPQVDVRAAGDLMARAGFALPVADVERVEVRYRDPFALLADLRGMGAAGMLADRPPPLDRARLAALAERFAADAGPGGRVTETVEIVVLTGWAPAPGWRPPSGPRR